MVWFGMSFLKPWNFEIILSDSYSLKNFWFFGSFGFPEFQYLSGMFSFRFGTYSFHSGMNSYLSGIHSFQCNFSHSAGGNRCGGGSAGGAKLVIFNICFAIFPILVSAPGSRPAPHIKWYNTAPGACQHGSHTR